MTINECLERVDKVLVNPYDEMLKVAWLSELDGRIAKEVLEQEAPVRYLWPDSGDVELLVKEPYEMLYDHWLFAMIHYADREYDLYNNDTVMFNTAFKDWAAAYRRSHRPLARWWRNVMP